MSSEQTLSVEKYHPPTLLWSLVREQTPIHEQEEIKRLLGYSLVEQSLELYDEVSLLLEIWRDYRQEANSLNVTSIPSRLPEPPEVRNRLKKEIKFFVECIREKSKSAGWCAEDIISRQQQNVLEYALQESEPSSHCVPVVTESDGRQTPLRPSSASASSLQPIASRLQNVKLDAENIDLILKHLRNVLSEDVTCLLDDITFLQKCLDGEVEHQQSASNTEPSLNELRQQRSNLEKELLSTSSSTVKPTGPSKVSPQSNTSHTVTTHTQRSLSATSGLVPSPSLRAGLKPNSKISGVTDRRKPLKALPSPDLHSPVCSPSSNSSGDQATSNQSISHSQSVSSPAADYGDSPLVRDETRSKPSSRVASGVSASLYSHPRARSTIGSASPSHVIIRTNSGKSDAKLTRLNAIVASAAAVGSTAVAARGTAAPTGSTAAAQRSAGSVRHVTTTSAAAQRRDGAAQRFRNMVLECRETSS